MGTAHEETRASRKARGGIYTPPPVAAWLAEWAIRSQGDRVLEPSCGDGVFLAAAADRFAALGSANVHGRLVGVERDSAEAAKARAAVPAAHVRTKSFFDLAPADLGRFDAVIGNPPYIRSHGFTGDERARALARAADAGVRLSNLASSWAHFVVHAGSFLRPGGRLGLVLPGELLHTDYAAPVRAWLLRRFGSVRIAFDRAVFPDAQIDAVLLLASDDGTDGLRVERLRDVAALCDSPSRLASDDPGRAAPLRWSSSVDAEAHSLYEREAACAGARRLGDFATVDIGVVTGANAFFILTPEEAHTRHLPDAALLPIVRSAAATPGLVATKGTTERLLRLPDGVPGKAAAGYLAEGERQGIPGGYKCRTRRSWYRVPLPRARPQAFLPYMHHHVPRLIVNRARAWSTNLLHGVHLGPGAPDARALSAAMLSSLTLLSAEIEGRAYGGGVLKTETKEAERLLIPPFSDVQESRLIDPFPVLDRMVQQGSGLRRPLRWTRSSGSTTQPSPRRRRGSASVVSTGAVRPITQRRRTCATVPTSYGGAMSPPAAYWASRLADDGTHPSGVRPTTRRRRR